MARPRKDPAEKLVRVNLTLRRQDIEALRRLAAERLILVVSGAVNEGPEAARALIDQRPSVSSAIRWLIDAERARRLARARDVDKAVKWMKGDDRRSEEELLAQDLVFGSLGKDILGPIDVEKLQVHEVLNVGEWRVGGHRSPKRTKPSSSTKAKRRRH